MSNDYYTERRPGNTKEGCPIGKLHTYTLHKKLRLFCALYMDIGSALSFTRIFRLISDSKQEKNVVVQYLIFLISKLIVVLDSTHMASYYLLLNNIKHAF